MGEDLPDANASPQAAASPTASAHSSGTAGPPLDSNPNIDGQASAAGSSFVPQSLFQGQLDSAGPQFVPQSLSQGQVQNSAGQFAPQNAAQGQGYGGPFVAPNAAFQSQSQGYGGPSVAPYAFQGHQFGGQQGSQFSGQPGHQFGGQQGSQSSGPPGQPPPPTTPYPQRAPHSGSVGVPAAFVRSLKAPEFDSADKNWGPFKLRFLSFAACNGVDVASLACADAVFHMLLNCVKSGEAYSLLASLQARGLSHLAWQTLLNRYQPVSQERSTDLWLKLHEVKMRPGSSPEAYIAELRTTACDLLPMGETASEGFLVVSALKGLLPKYDQFRTYVELDGPPASLDLLLVKLRRFAATMGSSVSAGNDLAFRTASSADVCHNCGGVGHFSSTCTSARVVKGTQRALAAATAARSAAPAAARGGGRSQQSSRSRSSMPAASAGSSRTSGNRPAQRQSSGTWCDHHQSTTHNTADCRERNKQQRSAPANVVHSSAASVQQPDDAGGISFVTGQTQPYDANSISFVTVMQQPAVAIDLAPVLYTQGGVGTVMQRVCLDSGSTLHVLDFDLCPQVLLDNLHPPPQPHFITVGGRGTMPVTAFADLRGSITAIDGSVLKITVANVAIVPGFGIHLWSLDHLLRSQPDSSYNGSDVLKLGNKFYDLLRERSLAMIEVDFTASASDQCLDFPAYSNGLLAASTVTTVSLATVSEDIMHRRLSHVNYRDMRSLLSQYPNIRLTAAPASAKCIACLQGKATRKSHSAAASTRASAPFSKVYLDLFGPIRTPALESKAVYAAVFICDLTRWSAIYPLRSKDGAGGALRDYLNQHVKPRHLHVLQSDGAPELKLGQLKELCDSQFITQQFSPPYSPESNGVVERKNRSILNGVRSNFLAAAHMPEYLWFENARFVVYTSNRVPTSALGGRTPYDALHGSMADISRIRVWGSHAFVRDPLHINKLEPRATLGYVVGFNTNSPTARIYMTQTRRVISTEHFSCVEEVRAPPVPASAVRQGQLPDDDLIRSPDFQPKQADPTASLASNARTLRQPVTKRVPRPSVHRMGTRHAAAATAVQGGDGADRAGVVSGAKSGADGDSTTIDLAARSYMTDLDVLLAGDFKHLPMEDSFDFAFSTGVGLQFDQSNDTPSYASAMKGPDKALWGVAVKSELSKLFSTGCLKLVSATEVHTSGVKVLPTTVVLRQKRDQYGMPTSRKARVCAMGNHQQGAPLQTRAPVAYHSSIFTVAAIAAKYDLQLRSLDVVAAFTQADLEPGDVVYLLPPKGLETYDADGRMLYWKACKSIYGLRQSPANFHKKIKSVFAELDFTPSTEDPCVLVNAKSCTIIVLWVDDMILAGKDVSADEMRLSKALELKVTGDAEHFVGLSIVRDRARRAISISVNHYIAPLLAKFGMTDCVAALTPRAVHPEDAPLDAPDSPLLSEPRRKEFQQVLGGLGYIAYTGRPDIAFDTMALARRASAPTEHSWTNAMQVLRYLKGADYKLHYEFPLDHAATAIDAEPFTAGYSYEPVAYCDASWGPAFTEKRRSVSGIAVMFGGGPIYYSSHVQSDTATSSNYAEYIALYDTARVIVVMRRLFESIGYPLSRPTTVYEDNLGAIATATSDAVTPRNKHFELKYHYAREQLSKKRITLRFIPSDLQLADGLTKGLDRFKHKVFALKITNTSHVE